MSNTEAKGIKRKLARDHNVGQHNRKFSATPRRGCKSPAGSRKIAPRGQARNRTAGGSVLGKFENHHADRAEAPSPLGAFGQKIWSPYVLFSFRHHLLGLRRASAGARAELLTRRGLRFLAHCQTVVRPAYSCRFLVRSCRMSIKLDVRTSPPGVAES